MVRYCGVLFLGFMVLGLAGCPRPISDGRQEAAPPRQAGADESSIPVGPVNVPALDQEEPGEATADEVQVPEAAGEPQAVEGDSGVVEPAGPVREAATAAGPDAAYSPRQEPEVKDNGAVDADAPELDVDVEQAAAISGPEQLTEEEIGGGALDAERFLWVDEGDEPAFEKPAARVSRESLVFAGRWVVVVTRKGRRARGMDYDDSWVLELGEDGTFFSSQRVDGEIWEQTGGWELIGGQLALNLGPGGQRTYRLELQSDDVCTLSEAESDAVLFCIRVGAEAERPGVPKRLDSDFGPIRLRRSGPGHYSGTYGEPEGRLILHQLGDFLVGTWEQRPGEGFVILQLVGDGFEGVWWYEGSGGFDGTWRARADG